MRKKLLTIFLAAALTGCMLSACGSAADQENAAEEAPEAEQAEQESEEPEPLKDPEIITVYKVAKGTYVQERDGAVFDKAGWSVENTYDHYGNTVKSIRTEVEWDTGAEKSSETTYEYEYDAVGRVLKMTRYTPDESGERYMSGETECEYDGRGNLIKEREVEYYSKDYAEVFGETHRVLESEYNEHQNVVRMIYATYNGDTPVYTDESRYEYEYDSEGRVTKETPAYADGSGSVTEYEYDSEGRITKETWGGGESVTEYEYDSEGRTTKQTTVFSEGGKSVEEKAYDEHGGVINEKRFSISEDGTEDIDYEVSREFTYQFDDAGNILVRKFHLTRTTRSRDYDYDTFDEETGTYDYEEVYNTENCDYEEEYDDQGNMIRETEIMEDGYTTIREYDAHGNMTREVQDAGDGSFKDITEYEYIELQVPDVHRVE